MRPVPTSSRLERRTAAGTSTSRWWKIGLTVAAFAVATGTSGWRVRPVEPAGAGTVTVVDDGTGETVVVPAGGGADAPPASTSSTAPPAPARGALVIHGTGDVNLDPAAVPALRRAGHDPWAGVRPLFLADDLTVVNLECAASRKGRPVPKEFNFRCDTAALPAMRAAGVEVANLANNHAGDFGPEALLDSVDNLRAAGVHPVGVGRDVAAANRPVVVEAEGWRIAVLGFGGVVPSSDWIAGVDHPGMADGDDTDAMVAAVTTAAAEADLVVVTVHWGTELDTEPRPDDVVRAHRMIEAGADVVFGHHAHRLQPLGWHAQRPVAWGLGNFVWPRLSAAGATTAVARVEVAPDGVIDACLVPAVIDGVGRPVPTGAAGEGCGAT